MRTNGRGRGRLTRAVRGGGSVVVTGVAFCHGGGELVASYNSEQVYSFGTAEHARPAHAFGATADLDSRCGARARPGFAKRPGRGALLRAFPVLRACAALRATGQVQGSWRLATTGRPAIHRTSMEEQAGMQGALSNSCAATARCIPPAAGRQR